jgi:sugar phosphate isomerase/epimerase
VHAIVRADREGHARVSFPDRVANAAAAGFAAIGTSPRDYAEVRASGLSDADIAAVLDEHGMVIGEIDSCPVWLGDGEPDPGTRERTEHVFHMAERFGPVHHTILPIATGGETLPPVDVLAERCGALADRAGALGMLAAIEFVPWGPLDNAADAWDLAQHSGSPHCGITVDFWHHLTGAGARPDGEQVLRSVPGARIHAVHFTDGAPDLSEADPLRRTQTQRRIPGDGTFPMVETIRLLDEIGADLPFTVEVVSLPHRALTPAEFAVVLHDAAVRILAEARGVGSTAP